MPNEELERLKQDIICDTCRRVGGQYEEIGHLCGWCGEGIIVSRGFLEVLELQEQLKKKKKGERWTR